MVAGGEGVKHPNPLLATSLNVYVFVYDTLYVFFRHVGIHLSLVLAFICVCVFFFQ